MAKPKPITERQLSSIRAITQKYGSVLRQHQEKDGTIILHCQKTHDPSAKLFRIDYPDGLTHAV